MTRLLTTMVAALALTHGAVAADRIRIGYITTLSGPSGIIGKHQKDGADLALEQLGGKLGGLPAEIVYGDDQLKPDVGRQLASSMIDRDHVDVLAGLVFSNVLLAALPAIVAARKVLIGTAGGPSEIAGKMCSRYFFSSSWQNDQPAEAMGRYLTETGVDDVYLMAPNYAAGRDNLAGFKRTFKGKIAAEVYTNLNQPDYQSELSQIRAANPKAVFVFYPGGLGIQFVKQFAQAGLHGKIPLYSVFTQNEITLPALGTAANGNYETGFWAPTLTSPDNAAFVAAFRKKYGYVPSEYAATSYDGIKLIDRAVASVKGDVGNTDAFIKALETSDVRSVRGMKLTFNTNHFLIQTFYLFKVADEASGTPTLDVEKTIVADAKDAYAETCPLK